jgi:hypothetical protein
VKKQLHIIKFKTLLLGPIYVYSLSLSFFSGIISRTTSNMATRKRTPVRGRDKSPSIPRKTPTPDFDRTMSYGTLESDAEDTEVLRLPSPMKPSTSTQLDLPTMAPKPVKISAEKSGDINKQLLEQMKNINLRLMALEEKVDNNQRTLDMIYRSFPTVSTLEPKSGVVTMTNW